MAILFRGRRSEGEDVSRRITDLTRAILSLEEEATVTVSEIMCADPGCEGLETVVMVMRPGRPTAAVKIKMPMGWVTEPTLREVLAALGDA